jgi:hypothetical protein
MKYITFRPQAEFKHHGRISSEQYLHLKHPDRNLTGCDVFTKFLEKSKIQEKPPLGIETSMVYFAIPAGLAVWVGLIYLVKFLFL